MRIPISVIIPVYNKEKYIEQAAKSVIRQTYSPMEIIFVDDCSTDESVKIIEKLQINYKEIKLIRLQKNSGVSCARNAGAHRAKYDIITFMDSDDYYINLRKLENEYKLYILYKSKEVDCCVYSKVVLVDKAGTRKGRCPKNKKYLQGNIFVKQLEWVDFSVIPRDYLVSKQDFFKAGGYNEKRCQYEDLELFFSLARENKFYCTMQEGTAYRQTGTGLSVDRNGSLKKNFDEVIEKNLITLPTDMQSKIRKKRHWKKVYTKYQRQLVKAIKSIIKPIIYKKQSFKKKAYIITINDSSNYGNRLQNYAVQYILKKLGFDTITIFFLNSPNLFIGNIKYRIHKITDFRYAHNRDYWKDWDAFGAKVEMFNRFNRKNIKSKFIKNLAEIGTADYYVLGSDQVWNVEWYPQEGIMKEMFLLSFAEPEQRICFSPSFGVGELPEHWIPWFKEQLAKFPMISVREESGAKIVKKLIGREATVTIDPTLMLDKDEWMLIAAKPKKNECDTKYILTYFLGESSEKTRLEANAYAEQMGARILDLMDRTHPELYASGPAEFIYLVSRASLILTDSFHACVFSFLFGKPFLLYKREGSIDMISRIDTFFNKFDLMRKYVNSGLQNELLECDYSVGYRVLATEREKMINFIKKSMKIF